jgi:YbbR domain-containing protein
MKTKGFWAKALADWPAKVLSLVVALLLFFFYHLNRLEQRSLSVPLAVTTNDEYVPSSEYPHSVKLALRGESNSLFQLQEEDIRASIDLSAVHGPGFTKATVEIEKRGNALGIDPLEIKAEPSTISVTMEHKASRVVPVTPVFHGYLNPGFELKSFDLSPGEVEIEGPESVIDRITSVSTEPIELSSRQADFSVKTRLLRGDPLVIITGADTADFRGAVVKAVALKTFSTAAVVASGLPEALALSEPLPAVRLAVKSQTVDLKGFELAPDSLSVDLSQVRRPGTYTLPILMKLPEGVILDSVDPQSLTVKIIQHQGSTE